VPAELCMRVFALLRAAHACAAVHCREAQEASEPRFSYEANESSSRSSEELRIG
jgi:hypothetical protein